MGDGIKVLDEQMQEILRKMADIKDRKDPECDPDKMKEKMLALQARGKNLVVLKGQ